MLNSSEVGCWVGWCWTNLCNQMKWNENHQDRVKERKMKQASKQSPTNLVFEHVKKRGLSGIIKTEEEDLGFFLPQTEGSENAIEPVKQEHAASWDRNPEIESERGGSCRSKIVERDIAQDWITCLSGSCSGQFSVSNACGVNENVYSVFFFFFSLFCFEFLFSNWTMGEKNQGW